MEKTVRLLRRILLASLLLTHVVWTLFAFGNDQPWTGLFGTGLFASTLPFSQVGLLAAVLWLGPGWIKVRGPVAVLGLGSLAALCLTAWTAKAPSTFESVLAAELGVLLVVFGVFRCCGGQIRYLPNPDHQVPVLQFSIRGLFVLTIASSFLVSGGHWVRRLTSQDEIVSPWVVVPLLALAFSLVVVLGVALLLRRGPVYARLAIYALLIAGLGWSLPHLVWRPGDAGSILLWMVMHGVLVGASLLVLRVAGYRLVNGRRQTVAVRIARPVKNVTPVPAMT